MALRTRNVVSLCAGVGGLELGIALALRLRGEDARGICYVEREAAAAASLVASMEGGWLHPAPVWSDLLTFDARPWRGLVHILASGDPCQDNSVAGKRAGADGQRFLAPEVIRIAEECGADLIFRENVPGNADGQLAAIVPALEGVGYCVAAGIFSSSETGNTMRRERLFIMAQRADLGHERGGAPRRRRAGPSDGGGRLARAQVQRPGEAGGDIGRSTQWVSGANGTLDGSQRAERRSIDSPCGEDGQHALSRWEEGPDGLGGPDTELASACGQGLAQRQLAEIGRGDIRHERDAVAACGNDMERAAGGGRGRKGDARQPPGRASRASRLLPPAVVPGPTDSRWINLLVRWPEIQPALSKEEAECHLRRGVDAVANRVERLRATGNGVDPVVAAYAFLSLGALLAADSPSSNFILN